MEFYILPHYGEEPFTDSSKKTFETYKNQLDLMRMNNSQAVIVNDKEIKVVSEQD